MTVRIDQINIEHAGPISDLNMVLKQFNLIYGLNEKGKTVLVEFLIRSLFKNTAGWSFRNMDSKGKIIVSGLTDKPISLTPSSRKKIEQHLAVSEPGLPARISRLMVVKGADLSFDDESKSSISRAALKEFLSGEGVLDEIQKRIKKTVRDAQFKDGQILGNKRGDLGRRINLKSDLERLDKNFKEIDKKYSGAERLSLSTKAQELQKAIDEQENARRHRAFLIDQKVQEDKRAIERIPEKELEEINNGFNSYQETQKRLKREKDKLADLTKESENYEWLYEAITLYETISAQEKVDISIIFPIVIVAAAILAIIFSFIYFPLTILFIVIALIFGWLYIRQYQQAVVQAADIEEIEKLEAEFENRFEEPLTGLPRMKELKSSMDEAYHARKAVGDRINEEQENLEGFKDQVELGIQGLTGKQRSQTTWEEDIRKLKEVRTKLQGDITQNEITLASLGVAEADYIEESAGVSFSQHNMEQLEEELIHVNEELKDKTGDLENLKQNISNETGDEITIDWEDLLHNLQLRREEILADYRKVTAKVAAGILVDDQLDIIRTQEEEKIRDKLVSPLVSTPIFFITNRYTDVYYEDGELSFAYDYGQFELGELSTGAREQVLLGLRLGFAAHLFQKEKLFLLLDDAFQHADWERRVRLVTQVMELAKDGWQITYLTMDDHLRDLFNTAGRENFSEHYEYFELNAG